jgi:hypothetical protein
MSTTSTASVVEGFNPSTHIDFENSLPKIVKIQQIRDRIISEFKKAALPQTIIVVTALKLSISNANLTKFKPIKYKEGKVQHEFTKEDFARLCDLKAGPAAKEDAVTVNRFCAAFSPEIKKYLAQHPEQARTRVAGVRPELSFPHNYYLPDLTLAEARECILWLNAFDARMQAIIPTWRSFALKATAYLTAKGFVF